MIAILYFGTIYGLEKLGSSTMWKPSLRGLLADYAYVVRSLFRQCHDLEYGFNSQHLSIDRNSLLGRILTFSRSFASREHLYGASLSRLLSIAGSRLVNPFLAFGCQMGLCCIAVRIPDYASFLL